VVPVVEDGRLVGMVAQADIALKENEKRTAQLVGRSPSRRRKSGRSVGGARKSTPSFSEWRAFASRA